MTPDALFDRALSAHRAGDLADAEALYGELLAGEPEHANALHNLAILNRDRGRPARAAELLTRAAAARPHDASIWNNLGGVLRAIGRAEDAVVAYRKATEHAPQHLNALFNLGTLLGELGRSDEAVDALRRAAALAPGDAEIGHALARAYAVRGDLTAAADSFRRALELEPGNPRHHFALASTLRRQGRIDEATAVFRRCAEVAPDHPPTLLALAECLRASARAEEALVLYQQVLARDADNVAAHGGLCRTLTELDRLDEAAEVARRATVRHPRHADTFSNLGVVLERQGDSSGAAAALRQAVALAPAHAGAHTNLGVVLLELGEIEDAIASFERALELDPFMSGAWLNLSRLKRFSDADGTDVERLAEHLARDELPDETRIELDFALGNIYDACGRFERAFEYYRDGNALRGRTVHFDAARLEAQVETSIQLCDHRFFEQHAHHGSASERPLFVIGMPRSGTTLVEQIMASHPQVFGAGELTTVAELITTLEQRFDHGPGFPAMLEALDDDAWRFAERQYLAAIDGLDRQATRVIDKMPTNLFNLGFIRVLFPHATIVYCSRDAMDVCLSNYLQMFAHGHEYSHDLHDIARYYRCHQRIMQHWREVLGDAIIEFDYDALIDDQEGATRELVARCGLPWDDACLAFHRTRRTVRTASNWQVRQPLYRRARKRWQHYAPWLGELERALAD